MNALHRFLALTLFATVAATGARAEESTFKLRAGDVLQVTVWKEDALDREVVVLPDDTITFPLIGSLDVHDQTPEGAKLLIKSKLQKFIPDASVTVTVKAPLGHTVNVIGQVTKPGEIVMGRHLSVMQALSQAGGLTAFASESGIKILRRVDDKDTVIPFPYDDVASGDALDKDIVLQPGDVVVVPTGGLF